ncbi:MAG TPA: hypothetical protein VGK22_03475 [Candidatus Angelobacter sp.]
MPSGQCGGKIKLSEGYTNSSWQALIGQMEIARERGQTAYAMEGLSQIRTKAIEQGNWEAVGLATAHIIVCYKHLYQNTGSGCYLLTMEDELKQALTLLISDSLKAAFWMRWSDIEYERGSFSQAESCCRQAHLLIEKNTYAEAECLSRWGYAKTKLGALREAEDLFARATEIIAGIGGPRTFRQVTLESGLFARRTQLCLAQKRYVEAVRCFIRGYMLAWEYRLRYGMPQRVRQYHQRLFRAFQPALKRNDK